MKTLAEARLKRVRALELAGQGASYDAIAEAVGYAHRGSAHRAVFKALDEREVEDVETLRRIEGERLDSLLAALWSKIQDGEIEAILTALRITDRRIRLLGLDRKAASSESDTGFAALVVDTTEGAERATMSQVVRWSERDRSVPM
ncbi:hypothetical protein ENKNEFLB_03615 [Nocardioides aquaticus]|uniref:Helix-turn-helix domain-containing protein n=1 Tax=Nocardioides aquaticus TaxID=160826 RepID=A0ABX8EKZ6_9ACTN|nr:hypothetical protein [Nocardioides aquaticus]QVT81207.1 hypothetical protein ENKNEFLB_03615 [Nocardioides aquaticus]